MTTGTGPTFKGFALLIWLEYTIRATFLDMTKPEPVGAIRELKDVVRRVSAKRDSRA